MYTVASLTLICISSEIKRVVYSVVTYEYCTHNYIITCTYMYNGIVSTHCASVIIQFSHILIATFESRYWLTVIMVILF